MTRSLVLMLATATFLCASIAQAAEPLMTFVFAGQSNMVGRRCQASELPPEMREENPNALFFQSESNTWVPIAPGRTEPQGFGPEIAFAYAMTQRVGRPIGIIKHSRGGTNLHRQWDPDSGSSLFAELVGKVNAAAKVRPIQVTGMLWIQGGADAKTEEMANAYSENLKRLIERSRVEFKSSEMFFLSGRIPPKDDQRKPFWRIVRAAQQDLSCESYAWINCDDLSKGPDNVHYDTPGMVELGRRAADLMAAPMTNE